MADGALVVVDLSARYQIVLIGMDRRDIDQFAIDAHIQWNAGNQPLVGQRPVGHRYRRLAKPEPPHHSDRYQGDSKENAK